MMGAGPRLPAKYMDWEDLEAVKGFIDYIDETYGVTTDVINMVGGRRGTMPKLHSLWGQMAKILRSKTVMLARFGPALLNQNPYHAQLYPYAK